MGEVTISVAGRAYQVICEDGEEDRLRSIAARVNDEAQAFSGAAPSLSEARLLLMCSLLLADKLDEAEKTTSPAPAPPPPAPAMAEADTTGIEAATARIAALTRENPLPLAETAGEPATEEIGGEMPVAPQPAPARRSKSSAATAAEKDLLSWLDRPEARARPTDEPPVMEPEILVETTDIAPPAADEPRAETADLAEEAPESQPQEENLTSDPQPDVTIPAESEEEQAIRERSERRARRRARLSRLASQDDTDD